VNDGRDRSDFADLILSPAVRSGLHHRNGDIAIDESSAGEIVLWDIFVGLVSNVERARAKHDAHGADVMKVN
jgi:hypothetical protein